MRPVSYTHLIVDATAEPVPATPSAPVEPAPPASPTSPVRSSAAEAARSNLRPTRSQPAAAEPEPPETEPSRNDAVVDEATTSTDELLKKHLGAELIADEDV